MTPGRSQESVSSKSLETGGRPFKSAAVAPLCLGSFATTIHWVDETWEGAAECLRPPGAIQALMFRQFAG